ncbi:PREDICTED: ATP-binding cassette sub-family A member 3-like isoform X2 [Papilio xuthus]|uniref:ATP-binding cassette sub-family A member 3-like isoform X2 n=1 Tax=Papilio xuthus TaxID=66420 RepID=A0AAJ6ZCC8_PAPXU|nr:PREDICTED: ATP-binding cassette sub-family A member 3-like isoform X2 [Papilio xuthus]
MRGSLATQASAWTKFRLLMWKNFMHQWRHKKQTLIELVLPVATMALVLILRQQIEPVVQDTKIYPPIRAHTLNYSLPVLIGMNITQLSFAYSPENPMLDDVVRSAVVNLLILNIRDLLPTIFPDLADVELRPRNLNRTIIFEFLKIFVKVKAYNSSTELEGIYGQEEETQKVLAAIEFDDNLKDATELPINISYALRFPERPRLNSFYLQGGRTWRTDAIFPVFELPGPRFPYSWEGGNDPGYVNEIFIALQHAVSMELISRMTGNNLRRFTVNLQRYPHPPYVEDLVIEALQLLFPMFVILSFSYTAVNIVRAVTVEKELQLKESMKIMGLPTWLHWTAWFCKQFLYLLFSTILIVVLLKVNWFTNEQGFNDYAVFTHTPWTVLFFFITLYLSCMIFFCFMISGMFSRGSSAALFAGVVWFLSYVPAVLLSLDFEVSTAVQVLTCFSINTAMSYGFQLMLAKESTGGIQWGQFMASNAVDSSRFVFGHVVIMLLVDCLLYMLIALYLEKVLPGPYGVAQPWYFPFMREFWCPQKKHVPDDHIDEDSNIIKEKDPLGHEIGVKITNLTKVYGNNVAVNNLNLNLYQDQITVLLGHNGAGKSTTISMITGNVEVTRGTVWVAGYDVRQHLNEARANLGLCPQHNVLFNELTVKEHLQFYARLKGYTGQQVHDEVDMLISNLEMQDKRDYLAGGLSGGQKRRLCVGIALSGGASVVLLDEPTSGMDPASRRALWDLLQKMKKGRTMILTTHFMDEADILGDRVAIMSSGRLQCVGSPYFLKQHYGVGYTLVVVKKEDFSPEMCTDIINKYIPNTLIKEDRGTEVTYALTNNYSYLFEDMLNDLERNAENIHFKNYGLVATTLEDVFMSVGSDVELQSDVDDTATVCTSTSGIEDILRYEWGTASTDQLDKQEENLSGHRLMWLHVVGVWQKLWWVWSRSWGVLVLQVLVPLVMINATLGVLQYIVSTVPAIQSRALTLAEGYLPTETLLSYNLTSETTMGGLMKLGYELFFGTSESDTMALTVLDDQTIDDYYMEQMENSITRGYIRNRMLIGASFTDDSATAWFSNFGYHDVATSLATMHSAILKAWNTTANINVFNHPLRAVYRDQGNLQLMITLLSMQIASSVGNSLGIISAAFVMFYVKERVSRAKLLQKAAGVQPVVLWGAAAVFDWFWYLLIAVTIIISCAAFDVIGLSTTTELGRLYFCLMIYGAAMLPMHYLLSHVFSGPALGFVIMFFINVLFGMMGSQIVQALASPQLDTKEVADVMDKVLQFFPLYSLVTSVRSLNQIGLTEYTCMQSCDYLAAVLPNMRECTMEILCESFSESCCVRENPYFDWEEPGILRYLVFMIISGIVFWLLLMMIEYKLIQKIFTREKAPPAVAEGDLDEDVADEGRHVQRIGGSSLAQHGLVARNLSKYYGKHLAVDQVSFSVSDGECFGLLGVNGAGKTSTFKMLMGDETISSGEAYVSGYSVKKDITKVYENIGYCPQFDAVFGELTGRETLLLFSLFRGLPYKNSDVRAELLAASLGFTKHLDKRVEQYSGGNKRKLSTAVALLGRTRLVFVDEPTSGVDPAAKRQVWRAVQAARRAGRGVLLTSHSMEECEALCSRLTIMVNGRFKCLGTPQHLKNKFSEGFTLTIKMKMDEDGTPNENTVVSVKNFINCNFTDPKLMEEYQGLLTYYLPDRSMAWSRMFGVIERAKRELEVEDYSISQTTLEQIFLQFTKYQREGIQQSSL